MYFQLGLLFLHFGNTVNVRLPNVSHYVSYISRTTDCTNLFLYLHKIAETMLQFFRHRF